MKTVTLAKSLCRGLIVAALIMIPANFYALPLPQSPPNINVNGYISGDKIKRGRSAQAVVVMEIPSGYHVNSNRPLEKFLIPTQLQVESEKGLRVSTISYPRAILRRLKFSKSQVAVYEGRATMRFNVSVPANFGSDSTNLRVRLKYQSCNDEVCFPPQSRELTIPVKIIK